MTAPSARWEPVATPQMLRLRATLMHTACTFFAERKVLEVETPMLVGYTVSDPQTDALAVAPKHWLRTSPEYHLKRLLAANQQDVYEIGKVFRAGETGRYHQPEFTLIEWYRLGFSMAELAAETCDLISSLLQAANAATPPRQSLTYREAFLRTCKLDPLTATTDEIVQQAKALLGEAAADLEAGRTVWLDLLASQCVYPALGKNTLQIVSQYPAEQAMLARLSDADPRVAERFEVFFNGIELANGYRELTDAAEQSRRFATDNEIRRESGKPEISPDPHLLTAIEAGLPDCAGVALGFDRVLMTATDSSALANTMSFTPGN